MRKFLLNGAVISSLFGIFKTMRNAKAAPSTAQTLLVWAAWIGGLALAIVAVRDRQDDSVEFDEN